VGCLDVPVEVMTGAQDRFAPPVWAARLATLASGRCSLVPGAHNACFTAPAATDQVVQRAVRSWTASGG